MSEEREEYGNTAAFDHRGEVRVHPELILDLCKPGDRPFTVVTRNPIPADATLVDAVRSLGGALVLTYASASPPPEGETVFTKLENAALILRAALVAWLRERAADTASSELGKRPSLLQPQSVIRVIADAIERGEAP